MKRPEHANALSTIHSLMALDVLPVTFPDIGTQDPSLAKSVPWVNTLTPQLNSV